MPYKIQSHASLIVVFIISVIGLIIAQNGTGRTTPKDTKTKQRTLPIVEFNSPEPTDDKIRAKRRENSARYDGSSSQPIQDVPSISGRIWAPHWSNGIAALPVSRSDAVVTAVVTSANAYFSNDKTAVYSEFSAQIDEVLKDTSSSLAARTLIPLERFGGAVRFPSGAVQEFFATGQGMPLVSHRYLFFLKKEPYDSFTIITGYELGETVLPLDGAAVEEGRGAYAFDKYDGFDTTEFLQIVRTAIAPAALQTGTKP